MAITSCSERNQWAKKQPNIVEQPEWNLPWIKREVGIVKGQHSQGFKIYNHRLKTLEIIYYLSCLALCVATPIIFLVLIHHYAENSMMQRNTSRRSVWTGEVPHTP